MANKLSYEDFFKKAILNLRNIEKSQGIHSVFSGFNQAFREYYNEEPVKITQELAAAGKIEIRPVKRGVMIYLPGEAPQSRKDMGAKALSAILGEPIAHDKGLVDTVLDEIGKDIIKSFPDDFIDKKTETADNYIISVPGTPLLLDPNSEKRVCSPKRHFIYDAKNPSEAKFIIYSYKIGDNQIEIPKDNQITFRAVKEYEKYCSFIKRQCLTLFLQHTNDEDLAELLVRDIEKKLDLRATNCK